MNEKEKKAFDELVDEYKIFERNMTITVEKLEEKIKTLEDKLRTVMTSGT